MLCLSRKINSQEYFQQEVNYKITVTLDDGKHELNCFETLEYINNSHDTLNFLYFHLWPNGYSNNKTALAREILSSEGKSRLFKDPELQGFIDSLDFAIDGQKAEWKLTAENIDICRIILKAPLKPGDTILISTPFHVKIPSGVTSRLGHTGESYQITQWYPKPAVYDKSGWHQFPYLNQGEFYSEYGSFDVSITLPDNYTVGASGDLQNNSEMKRLDSLARDITWMKESELNENYFPPSSGILKTLRYKRDKIHDFAWFADKRFHVTRGKVKLPGSGREVTTWGMFTNQDSYYWLNAISYINNAILNYSKWIGEYPYNNFTAVQSAITSGSGMEYPGLTVIGRTDDPYMLEEVLAHEICHSWFYSALGSNERRYPFMDESIVSAYESRYMEESHPDKKLWEVTLKIYRLAKLLGIVNMPVQRLQELDWLIPARQNLEQPLNLAADDYSESNYTSMIYSKGAQGFNYLRYYLGNSGFDSIMHDYFRIWKNKHPGPDDLRSVFETDSRKDLSWFFNDFLGTVKRLDYKMVHIRDGRLLVKNNANLYSPLTISGINRDSVNSGYWIDGFKGKKWIDAGGNMDTGLIIDPGHRMTELFRLNNKIRTKGIFPKSPTFRLQFLYTIEDPDRLSLIYVPAFGWTRTDGFLAGLSLNNGALLLKPVEYSIIPFYAFGSRKLSGYGKITFNKMPYNNIIRLASFSVEGTKFGAPGQDAYKKLKVGLDLFFRPGNIKNAVNQKISGYYVAASDLSQIEQFKRAQMRSYLQFGYLLDKSAMINPFSIQLYFESGKQFQKTSLEFNYRYSYYGKRSGLEIRLFAGTMIKNKSSDPFYAFAPAGRSGNEQYLYEGYFPDRFTPFPKTFLSRQMTLSEGGLVTPVNDTLGYSRQLGSLTLTSGLPRIVSWLPVKPFLTVLLNDHGIMTDSPALFFEAGFKTGFWDFFEIYFPLLVSENISSIRGTLRERIRFVLNLDILSPEKMRRILSE